MKKLVLVLIACLAVSCSKKSVDKSSQVKNEEFSSIQELVISQNNELDIEIINLGAFKVGTTKSTRLRIVNNHTAPVSLVNLKSAIESWDDATAKPSSVLVTTDSCSSKTLGVNKSCFMDVKVSYNEEISSLDIYLSSNPSTSPSIRLLTSIVNDNIGATDARLAITNSTITSATKAGSTYVSRIVFKNLSELASFSFPSGTVSSLLNAPNVNITRNLCDGKTIAKLGSCFVDIAFQPTQDGQTLSFSMNIPSANVSQTVSVNNSNTNSPSFVSIGNFDYNAIQLQLSGGVQTFYSLPNGHKYIFKVNQEVYNEDYSAIITPPSTEIFLYNGTTTTLVKTLPDFKRNNSMISQLINNQYLLLVQSANNPSDITKIKLIDINNAYAETTLVEQTRDSLGNIQRIVRYSGSSNNDKILVLTVPDSSSPLDKKYRIHASNSTYTGFDVVLESDDFTGFDSFLSSFSLDRNVQLGDKLIFSLTGFAPLFGVQSYSLYSFDGTSVTKLFQRNGQTQSGSYEVGFDQIKIFNNKVYQLAKYAGCAPPSFTSCFVDHALVESDGTVANTQVIDEFTYSFVTGQNTSGAELFSGGFSPFVNEVRILDSLPGGLVYSWFETELQSGFDYSTGDPGMDPCSFGDFSCANLNYQQQIGKKRVKKLSSAGVESVIAELSTQYGYDVLNNPANYPAVKITHLRPAFDEFYFIKQTSTESLLYRTDVANNSVVVVENLGQSIGFDYDSFIDTTVPLVSLGTNELFFRAYIATAGTNDVYRKSGASSSVAISNNIPTGYNFKVLGDKLYFETYEDGYQTYKLNYVQAGSGVVTPFYTYPSTSFTFDIISSDLFLHDGNTFFIYK